MVHVNKFDSNNPAPEKANKEFSPAGEPRVPAANPFTVGDVVHLKSGGPDMTVTAVDVAGNPNLAIPNIGVAYFVGEKMESTLGPAGIFMPSLRIAKTEKPKHE